jgi:hypothetical protein
MAYRHTTIGATAFHFRVRNGAGWFRYAMVTRVSRLKIFKREPLITFTASLRKKNRSLTTV